MSFSSNTNTRRPRGRSWAGVPRHAASLKITARWTGSACPWPGTWPAARNAMASAACAFILTRAGPEAQTLVEFVRWHCPDRATRDKLLQQLAATARTMHAGDFFHHDFVWRNILVNRAPEGTPLIDCPRGGVRRWGKHRTGSKTWPHSTSWPLNFARDPSGCASCSFTWAKPAWTPP